jgi:hypothetical protein
MAGNILRGFWVHKGIFAHGDIVVLANMNQELRNIATLELAKLVEGLSAEHQPKILAAQRAPGGGVRAVAIGKAQLDLTRDIAEEYAKVLLNLLEEHNGGELTREHVNYISEQVRSVTATRKGTVLSSRQINSVGAGPFARGLDRVVSSIGRDLELRLRRQNAGVRKEPIVKDQPMSVTIHHAANVNLGSQVGTINAALTVVSQQGSEQEGLAAAIRELSDAVVQSKTLSETNKEEALEVISTLISQAQAKPEERSKGTIKALIAGFLPAIGLAADVTTLWEKCSPVIRAFFQVYADTEWRRLDMLSCIRGQEAQAREHRRRLPTPTRFVRRTSEASD